MFNVEVTYIKCKCVYVLELELVWLVEHALPTYREATAVRAEVWELYDIRFWSATISVYSLIVRT